MSADGGMPLRDFTLDKEIYRALTKIKFASADSELSISKIINEMLAEYLHTYILSKRMGHIFVSRDTIRIAFSRLTDEQIMHAAHANAVRYKDGALLEYGKPSLNGYLELIKSFAKANKFEFEISKEPETENYVLIMRFGFLGPNFTKFKGETYKMLIQEYADIVGTEFSDTALFVKYAPRKEQVSKEQQPMT